MLSDGGGFEVVTRKVTCQLCLICARNLQQNTGFYGNIWYYTDQLKIPKRFSDFDFRLLMRFSGVA